MFQLHNAQMGLFGRVFKGLRRHGPCVEAAMRILNLVSAAALIAVSMPGFGQARTDEAEPTLKAPPVDPGTYGTTPRTTGIGAPPGSSSTDGTPLPGQSRVTSPERRTFSNILNSGSSTGSSAASGAVPLRRGGAAAGE